MNDKENLELYMRQKKLLDTFLSTGAITKAQYDKSLGDLKLKMEITDEISETQ